MLDLRGMSAAAGYGGSDPVTDDQLALISEGGGAKVMFDPDGLGALRLSTSATWLMWRRVISRPGTGCSTS